jgi:hypothetical protein
MKALYGLFPDADSAQRGYDALHAAGSHLGFDRARIVVRSSEPFEGYEFAEEEAHTPMYWLAALGGVVGAAIGYLLTSLTQRAYPLPTGAMPIVPPWTNGIIVYETTMLGAVLTTLITLLFSTRLPRFKTPLSDPQIWSGKILIGVTDPPAGSDRELETRLRQAGASEVNVSASV